MGFEALHNFKYRVVSDGAMSASITSDRVNIQNVSSIAVQFVWSAGSTPVGTMYVQGSIDGDNFVDISNAALSGNSGAQIFNLEEPSYSFIRVNYTRTSGSGTLNVYIAGKRF